MIVYNNIQQIKLWQSITANLRRAGGDSSKCTGRKLLRGDCGDGPALLGVQIGGGGGGGGTPGFSVGAAGAGGGVVGAPGLHTAEDKQWPLITGYKKIIAVKIKTIKKYSKARSFLLRDSTVITSNIMKQLLQYVSLNKFLECYWLCAFIVLPKKRRTSRNFLIKFRSGCLSSIIQNIFPFQRCQLKISKIHFCRREFSICLTMQCNAVLVHRW